MRLPISKRAILPLSGGFRLPGAWVLAGTLTAVVAAAQADDPGATAAGDTREAIVVRQQTQQQLDDWAAEKSELLSRYRAASTDVTWLEARREERVARLQALGSRVAEMRRRLDEADRLEASMQDTLLVILDRLEASVAAGLPFLPAERHRRLEALRAEIVRPDVDAAEKLRRLLEALQVEAGYASTVEVYRDEVEVGGVALHADILRLGRVSLFWRSPDGRRVGLFDQATGSWRELSGSAARRINLAMEMAARTRPVELIALPLGRVAAGPGSAP